MTSSVSYRQDSLVTTASQLPAGTCSVVQWHSRKQTLLPRFNDSQLQLYYVGSTRLTTNETTEDDEADLRDIKYSAITWLAAFEYQMLMKKDNNVIKAHCCQDSSNTCTVCGIQSYSAWNMTGNLPSILWTRLIFLSTAPRSVTTELNSTTDVFSWSQVSVNLANCCRVHSQICFVLSAFAFSQFDGIHQPMCVMHSAPPNDSSWATVARTMIYTCILLLIERAIRQ